MFDHSQGSAQTASDNSGKDYRLKQFEGKLAIVTGAARGIGAPDFESRIGHMEADWNATWNVNVLGTVNTISAVRDHMQEQRHGKIIIVSSQGGRPPAGSAGMWGGTVQQTFLISKSALIQYMHHLAIEMGPFNVNVKAVCPRTLWTPMWEKIAANHAVVNPELAGLEPPEFFARTV